VAKKKKKAAKLPKRLAGVKIPKAIRRSGGALLQQANTPLGRELIAAGLVAAGAALAKKDEVRRAAKAAANQAEDTAEDAAELGARMASQIGGVVGAAANAALDRLFGKPSAAEDAAEPPTPTAH